MQPEGPSFRGDYAVPQTEPAPDSGAVRVVTFNIKLSREIERAIRVLEDPVLRGADVITLQEMDDLGVEAIAQALRLNYAYFPATLHPADKKLFGPAILSRWPIQRIWKLVLPHEASARHQRRTATAAVLRIREQPVRVYAVHLETQTRMSRAWHRDQAAAIVSDAASAAEPVIIAGDFNSQRIGRFFTRNGYRWPTERVGPTTWFFSWDHIFVKGFAPSGLDKAGMVRQVRGASDHRPVWATLSAGVAGSVAASAHGAKERPERERF